LKNEFKRPDAAALVGMPTTSIGIKSQNLKKGRSE